MGDHWSPDQASQVKVGQKPSKPPPNRTPKSVLIGKGFACCGDLQKIARKHSWLGSQHVAKRRTCALEPLERLTWKKTVDQEGKVGSLQKQTGKGDKHNI